MGYVEKKYATIFKGPWMLYFRQASGGRKSVRLIIALRRLVLDVIPKEVAKKHNIEKALKKQDKVEDIAEEIDDKMYNVAFEIELDQEKAFEIIGKMEAAWEKAMKKGKKRDGRAILRKMNAEFQAELIKILKEEEDEEKEIYWRYLEPVIKSSEKEGQAMMAKIAQMFKTKEDVSRLAAVAFKWGARALRKSTINLKQDEHQLEIALKQLEEADSKKIGKATSKLRDIDRRIIAHASKEFKSTYLLLKRDLLLDIVLLNLLNTDDQEMRKFVAQHFMPQAPELKNMEDLKRIKKDIAEHGHVIAQGLRRLIAEESNIRGIAERNMALGRSMAA